MQSMNDTCDLAFRRDFKCGTPLVDALNKAVEAYHQGLPLGDRAFVDEVVLAIHGEWHKVGDYYSEEEGSRDIILPYVDIEGGEKGIFLNAVNPEDIVSGFLPERGHSYRVKVRRISIDHMDAYSRYELIEVLDEATRKSGVELGLEDIEAGRVYHAADAKDMIAQILIEGEESGVAEDFDPATFVQGLGAAYDEEVISFANWE